MKVVFEAIYQRFVGSALDTAVGGRCWPMRAPVGTEVPAVIVSLPACTSSYGFAESYLAVLVELSVYATDIVTMHEIADLATALYDDCTLPVITGYDQIGPMGREMAQPLIVDNVYRYIIEYKINLQKQN